MGKQSQPTSTTTQVNDPVAAGRWAALQPIINQASRVGVPQYYPGQNYAGLNATQQEALGMQEAMARAGNPQAQSASAEYERMMSGSYLSPDSNPWLGKNVDAAMRRAIPMVNSQFQAGGRYGGGLHAEDLTRTLGDISAGMYGQNYQAERDRMASGLSLGRTMADLGGYSANQLYGVGATRQADEQGRIGAEMDRWNFNQQAPMDYYSWLSGVIGNPGQMGSTTQTGTQYRNRTAGVMGGALSGAQMGAQFGHPVIGGLLGAVGGYF